jgi:hypothetical protein
MRPKCCARIMDSTAWVVNFLLADNFDGPEPVTAWNLLR